MTGSARGDGDCVVPAARGARIGIRVVPAARGVMEIAADRQRAGQGSGFALYRQRAGLKPPRSQDEAG